MLTRDDNGQVRALWYVSPDAVSVQLTQAGKLRYTVTPVTGGTITVPDGGMLHIVGPLSADGYLGRSVVATFRETLGLGLGLERYGAEFFANAATPQGVYTTPARLSEHARENLRNSFKMRHAASGGRHQTMILEEGLQWQSLGVSHEDSQFLDSRKFTVGEVARIFGVPGHMIGATEPGANLTYSNTETEGLRLLKHSIGPWLTRIAGAVNHVCISPLERFQMYAEHLTDSLLTTDTAGRFAAYKIGLDAGFLTIDEVRRKENLPALPTRAPAIG